MHIDLLLGRLALERGLVTRDQLADALGEQAKRGRALGEILVERGVLKRTDLDSILDEQKRRLADAFEMTDAKLEEALLGRMLIRQGLITEPQLYECLREQAALAEQGKPAASLGELLVRKHFLATDAMATALHLDKKAALICGRCGSRYRTMAYDSRETYKCKKCQGFLSVQEAETTTGLLPISYAPLPPEVEAASRDPQNRYAEGKYIRVREVGRGGMGVVWKGWQTDLERYVAIKQLTQAVLSETEMKRFLREAQTSARLSHPNIATIYEVGLHDGKNFIAMEFVDGDALSVFNMISPSATTRHGTDRRTVKHLPLRHALEVLRDAAGAVEYAHSKGVIHRDIKPHNIMLARSGGRVYVMDFGLAKPVAKDGISVGDTIVGTPPYMSPEQARGDAVERRSDVYSLGAVLYYLICGRAPFSGSSPADILMKVLTEEPNPPHTWNPSVPPDLEKICMKALEKDRHRRYESAKAFSDDISRFLKGEPVRARPMTVFEKIGRWSRENPAKVAGWIAACVMAGLLGGFLYTSWSNTRQAIWERRLRAEELVRAENYVRGLAEYEALLAIDPRNEAAEAGRRKCEQALREGRGSIFEIRREADLLFERGEFAASIPLFERLSRISQDPSIEERLLKARLHEEKSTERRTESDRKIREMSALTTELQQRQDARRSATPHYLAAEQEIEMARLKVRYQLIAESAVHLQAAEEGASRALGFDPGYPEARLLRIRARRAQGRFEGAVEDCAVLAMETRQGGALRASLALVRLLMRREAPMLRDSDDLALLEKEFHQAVDLASREPVVPADRPLVQNYQALVARQPSVVVKAILAQGRPSPDRALLLAAAALEETRLPEERFSAAVEYLTTLLDADAACVEALYLRSVLRSRLNEPKTALDDAERAVQLAPASPYTYLARAQASKLLGNFEQAVTDLQKAGSLEPRYVPALRKEIEDLTRSR